MALPQPKPLRLAGLARRAGKLVCGADAVKTEAGRARLILIAEDAGNTTKRNAEKYGRPVVTLPYSTEEMGRAVGKARCAIAAVIDEHFSEGIRTALQMEES